MRYFSKTFFKFALGFLCIVCASLLMISLASNFISEDTDKMQAASLK